MQRELVREQSSSTLQSRGEVREKTRFKLHKRIGRGAFGEIYLASNLDTGQEVAVKIESKSTHYPQLRYEARVYEHLRGLPGIAQLKSFGEQGERSVMVVELLGPSLEELFNECGRKFSRKTVLMIGLQMLTRISALHSRGFLHRDIKPENFCIGLNEKANIIFIIDFGLAKKYLTDTGGHIPPRSKKNLTGTARYASIHAHDGCEQGRRDDLESLVYVLVYFSAGMLPWQGLRATDKDDKYGKISERKHNTSIDALTKSCGVPELGAMLGYIRTLSFEQTPDYEFLQSVLTNAMARDSYVDDGVFDWTLKRMGVTAATTNSADVAAPPAKRIRATRTPQQPIPSPAQATRTSPTPVPTAPPPATIPVATAPATTPTAAVVVPSTVPAVASYVPSQVATGAPAMQPSVPPQPQPQLYTPTAPPATRLANFSTMTNVSAGQLSYLPPGAAPGAAAQSPNPWAELHTPPSPARLELIYPPPSPARDHSVPPSPARVVSDGQGLTEKLLWHRLSESQTRRLKSLLIGLDDLNALHRRLVNVLMECTGPSAESANELDAIDRHLQLLLSALFPFDPTT